MVNVNLVLKNLKKLKPSVLELSSIVLAVDRANSSLGADLIGMLSDSKLTHGKKISIGHLRQSINTNNELKSKVVKMMLATSNERASKGRK